jgi:nucleoid DNA-binding protein
MKRRNRELIEALIADGLTEEVAAEQVDRVLGAIAPALVAGRPVHLPGVGDLRPKRRRAHVPGSCDRQAREECRVSLRSGAIWKGEPYACEPPEKSKLSYINVGGLS